MYRIGIGTDLHRLIKGRKLMIGGITIPFSKGEKAHSDGDVLLHAITDAILGASGLGDIGSFFPPEDKQWKNADSAFLLKSIYEKVKSAGWHIENIDCVIQLEKPKFLPYRKEVIQSIARILDISTDQVFVKAKTAEKLESIGKSRAISAQAVCLLSK